jgi:hypothetical protein
MAQTVYILCAVTCLTCTGLLLRNYTRTRNRLVFWCGLCFLLLSISNTLIFVDLILLPQISLLSLRHGITLTGLILLLYGLIRENT